MLNRTFADTQTLRIAELHTLDVFFTPLEARFDRITRLARKALRVQAAAITLVDQERQWFKSVDGWDVRELPRSRSLCSQTVEKGEPIIVKDLLKDPEYASHPMVAKGPKFRFYAGFPLVDPSGTVIGTFCVFDTKPRSITRSDVQSLWDAGESAQKELLTNELREAQQQLIKKLGTARRQANLDELTRVWNRRGGLDLMTDMLEIANSDNQSLAVCMIDLDKFKEANDNFGHRTGDQVLRKVTGMIIGCLRSDDVLCRFGGDEFLLVLANPKHDDLKSILERIRDRVNEFPIETREGSVAMTLSIGAALWKPYQREISRDNFIELADKALMTAKRSGKNSVEIINCGDTDLVEQTTRENTKPEERIPAIDSK